MLRFDPDNLPANRSRVILDKRKIVGGDDFETLQTYTLVAARAHKNRFGEDSAVLEWQSRCSADGCNGMFRFKTGPSPRFLRRCDKCRRRDVYTGGGWSGGTKNRFTLHPPKEAPAAVAEIDPASLF